MTAIKFSGAEQEDAYHLWRNAHPTLFVLNTYLQPKAAYLVLHSASSRCVAMQNPTRLYSKICGTRDEIEDFVTREFGMGASPRPCLKCLR